jgi:hypothetical protein
VSATRRAPQTEDVLSILTHFTAKASGRKSKMITEIVLDASQLKDAYLMNKAGHSYREISERFEREGRSKDLKGKTITHNVVRARLLEHGTALEKLYGGEAGEVKNSFLQFVEKHIQRKSGSVIRRTEVVAAYKAFITGVEGGIPLNKTGIAKEVRKLGWKVGSDNDHCTIYKGISLSGNTANHSQK